LLVIAVSYESRKSTLNKIEGFNILLNNAKKRGVGDKGEILRRTVGSLVGIFCLLFWANRKRRTAGRQKPQIWFVTALSLSKHKNKYYLISCVSSQSTGAFLLFWLYAQQSNTCFVHIHIAYGTRVFAVDKLTQSF